MKYSAPAKIYLLGEHAVVYGKPALLTAIDLRISVEITKLKAIQRLEPKTRELQRIIEKVVKKKFALKAIPPYQLTITREFPMGSGLGSSAAVSAAFFASLLSYLKAPFDLSLINTLTLEAEKIFHGNPSGADNTTVVFGGLIWYRKELDFLKTFSPLPFPIHKNISNFVLIDSGKPLESTKEMVSNVRDGLVKNPHRFQTIFDDQERLTKELAQVLKNGDNKAVIQIMQQGERNLESLGVVSKKAQTIIKTIESLGGAAKVVGAGGKQSGAGMILCYNPPKQLPWPTIPIKFASEGLKKDAN